jgi:hypothetical protein
MLIIKRGAQSHRTGICYLANVPVSMERMEYNGTTVVAGIVPDDHPRAAFVRQAARKHPNFQLGDEKNARPEPPRQPAQSEAGPTSDAVVQMRNMAKANGWAYLDMTNTGGEGEPGEAGGRNANTGLTIADMAAIPAPEGWADLRETHYPWELADWNPPVATWSPPDLKSKRPEEVEEPAAEEEETEDPETEDEPDAEEDDGATMEGNPDGVVDDNDPALKAGYPAEHIIEARGLAHELRAKKGGDYHPNALNFLLRKADLPTVGKDQLAGLLARTP